MVSLLIFLFFFVGFFCFFFYIIFSNKYQRPRLRWKFIIISSVILFFALFEHILSIINHSINFEWGTRNSTFANFLHIYTVKSHNFILESGTYVRDERGAAFDVIKLILFDDMLYSRLQLHPWYLHIHSEQDSDLRLELHGFIRHVGMLPCKKKKKEIETN